MKAVKTLECDVALTLEGAGEERTLPAQRIMTYDSELGQTERDARHALQTTWIPTEEERARLEAGAAVQLIVTGTGHPPVSLTVTEAVLPGSQLVERGRYDRALGLLFGRLEGRLTKGFRDHEVDHREPDAVALQNLGWPTADEMLELWQHALDETKPEPEPAKPKENGHHA